ncbi:MAG: UbiD family decarboxylase, partial [Halobacteriales archaeon]|nr:UbiD family decarboxylase [Halobacteriales archaeon]
MSKSKEKGKETIDWVGLREFIDRAEQVEGEVVHITDAHWDREMSTISHELCRGPRKPVPAPIFDEIPDYPKGFRAMYGMTNSMNRLAIAVGLEPTYTHEMDFLRDYRVKQREIEDVEAIDPEFVDPKDAPVMENVDKGNDVDLFKFPVPKHHEYDGGRYIGTATSFITDNPETGRKANLGAYRVQVFNENQAGVYISPGKHGRLDIEDYWERDERVPVAASFGQDPVLFFYTSVGIEHTNPYGEY